MTDSSASTASSTPPRENVSVYLRNILRKIRLHRVLQTIRLLIHFGPWRFLVKRVIQITNPPITPINTDAASSLPALDPIEVAQALRKNSVVVIGTLDKALVRTLKSRTEKLPVDHYQLIHHIDADIQRLSEDPAIKAVLHQYLKCEPVLLEATIAITEGSKKTASSQNSFHFDYAGWESVNVFVYLTDVTEDSSYHMVAQGSHRDIALRDIFSATLSENEATRRFGDRILPIIGDAGTLFFENTEAFHRRNFSPERRVFLNLLYASHKSQLSEGRVSRAHINSRVKAYQAHNMSM